MSKFVKDNFVWFLVVAVFIFVGILIHHVAKRCEAEPASGEIYNAPSSPIKKSLFKEINEHPENELIREIPLVDDAPLLESDIQPTDGPVSFYSMDPMTLGVTPTPRFMRAAILRHSPRCDAPTVRMQTSNF